MNTATEAEIRWMVRRDMPQVMEIERESFEFAWSEADFSDVLKQKNCIGMVAEIGDKIAGFMLYELHQTTLHLLNFAVAHSHRRQGIGSQMVAKLVIKLSQQRREAITTEVRERNLAAQMFFRSCGFHATEVIRGHYVDTDEDAYRFVFELGECDG